mmetsp:Transcript_9468/g.12754  ORF Transcript_9468/g.12754 Transcript_9468/m.12754 type:complete len:205 (+) Transcript_9468:202-816(+)
MAKPFWFCISIMIRKGFIIFSPVIVSQFQNGVERVFEEFTSFFTFRIWGLHPFSQRRKKIQRKLPLWEVFLTNNSHPKQVCVKWNTLFWIFDSHHCLREIILQCNSCRSWPLHNFNPITIRIKSKSESLHIPFIRSFFEFNTISFKFFRTFVNIFCIESNVPKSTMGFNISIVDRKILLIFSPIVMCQLKSCVLHIPKIRVSFL